jgi:hypothetical protein
MLVIVDLLDLQTISYYHSSLRNGVMRNDTITFPQILGMVQWVFPEHERDWVLFIHRFFFK